MKLLKLTQWTTKEPTYVLFGPCVRFRGTGDPNPATEIRAAGWDELVTEPPEAIAAMLAEPSELEREAWRQMEACSQSIQSAMSTVEHAAMAVRNAQ